MESPIILPFKNFRNINKCVLESQVNYTKVYLKL